MKKVNLTDLAQNVVDDLAKSEPTRQVKVTIAPDIIAYGDRNLLHWLSRICWGTRGSTPAKPLNRLSKWYSPL